MQHTPAEEGPSFRPTVARIRGCRFYLRPRWSKWFRDDRAALLQVLIAGEYDELLNDIRPADRVLDCGANIGCFTVPAAKRVGPKGVVVAIEPDRDNVTVLRRNVALNRLGNVAIEEKALDSRSSPAARFVPGGVMGKLDDRGVETVETVTISDLVIQSKVPRFDIIKIDIEGSELPLLKSNGVAQVLGVARSVALEVHSQEAETECRQSFLDWGFEVSGPRIESEFLNRIITRTFLHCLQVSRLYGFEGISVALRVLRGIRVRSTQANAAGYRAGILLAQKPSISGHTAT